MFHASLLWLFHKPIVQTCRGLLDIMQLCSLYLIYNAHRVCLFFFSSLSLPLTQLLPVLSLVIASSSVIVQLFSLCCDQIVLTDTLLCTHTHTRLLGCTLLFKRFTMVLLELVGIRSADCLSFRSWHTKQTSKTSTDTDQQKCRLTFHVLLLNAAQTLQLATMRGHDRSVVQCRQSKKQSRKKPEGTSFKHVVRCLE